MLYLRYLFWARLLEIVLDTSSISFFHQNSAIPGTKGSADNRQVRFFCPPPLKKQILKSNETLDLRAIRFYIHGRNTYSQSFELNITCTLVL